MQDHTIHPDVIQKLKLGDIDAFEKIFRTFYKPLTRFAIQYTSSQDKAEDIVQEVMYRIWQNRKRLNKHKNLKTYLFTAVKNQALNMQKHEKVRQDHMFSQISIQIDFHSPDRVVQTKELAKSINSSITKLPETCRKTFCMNRFEHLSYKEIAHIQGVTVKAVEKQMTRAFRLLRKHLSSILTFMV